MNNSIIIEVSTKDSLLSIFGIDTDTIELKF